jgi:hypothetical protein
LCGESAPECAARAGEDGEWIGEEVMDEDDEESALLGGSRGEGAMWWCIGRSSGERCTGICDVRRTALVAFAGLIAGEGVPLS